MNDVQCLQFTPKKVDNCTAPSRTEGHELIGKSRFSKVRGVSRGTWGLVDLCWDKVEHEFVFLKFIERGSHITKYVQRMVLHHLDLSHPHIVHLLQVYLTKQHLVVVTEFVRGGSLQQYAQNYPKERPMAEDEAQWYFQQIAIMVDYLHRKGFASRDIRLDNLLMRFEKGRRPLLKLSGLAMSKHDKYESAPKTLQTALKYMAPEVLYSGGERAYDGKCTDIWAMGVILFRLIAGFFPFCDQNPDEPTDAPFLWHENMSYAHFELPNDRVYSPGVKDMLTGLLNPDPEARMTISQILQHPWFLEGLHPTVLTMNDALVDRHVCIQPVDEVQTILREAKFCQEIEHKWNDGQYEHDDDHQIQAMDPEEELGYLEG